MQIYRASELATEATCNNSNIHIIIIKLQYVLLPKCYSIYCNENVMLNFRN